MNNIITSRIIYKSYDIVSESPYTSSFTCSGNVTENVRLRANKYYLLARGYITFTSVTWTESGSFYAKLPFDTPGNIGNNIITDYNIIFSRWRPGVAGTVNYEIAAIDVSKSYLQFRCYMASFGSYSWSIRFHLPGAIMRYV